MGRKWPDLMREKRAARRTGKREAISSGLAETYEPLVEWNGLWLAQWKVDKIEAILAEVDREPDPHLLDAVAEAAEDGGPERCARCGRQLGTVWDLLPGEGAVCPIPSPECRS